MSTAWTGDISIPPSAGLAAAEFRAWVPPGSTGWLVLVPGSNDDWRDQAADPAWQAWAGSHRLALLGCRLVDVPPQSWMEAYAYAAGGSGQLLLDAIAALAVQAGQPVLAQASLLLVGHSAGGQFAYEFACWRPGRVAAFAANKGGVYYTHLASAAARSVPGLLLIGEHDDAWRRHSLKGIWALNRRAGARWALLDDRGQGHDMGSLLPMAQTFFAGVLAGAEPGVSVDHGHDEGTSWLPDAASAELWRRQRVP